MSRPGPYRLQRGRAAASIEFRFNGKKLVGLEGDTVTSALLANGVRVVSRSFKFHRPRGIFSAGFEEPNAIVRLHSSAQAIPCARATTATLQANLEVFTDCGWPGVAFDLLRALDFIHPV